MYTFVVCGLQVIGDLVKVEILPASFFFEKIKMFSRA